MSKVESGGVLESCILSEKDQKKIIQNSGWYLSILERFGFKEPREVWVTYLSKPIRSPLESIAHKEKRGITFNDFEKTLTYKIIKK